MTDLAQANAILHAADFAARQSGREAKRRHPAPWMQSRILHRLFGRSRLFRRLSLGASCQLELALLSGHKPRATLELIRAVRRERESLMGANESFLLHALASTQGRLDGAMAEVGVYQGCSAKLISIASRGRPLHLFDTFNGLPKPLPQEQMHLQPGQYQNARDEVQEFLAGQKNIMYYQGEFPQREQLRAAAFLLRAP